MKLEAGKWYRVKTWEQMEREFGLDEEGGIKCYPSILATKKVEQLISKQPNRMIQLNRVTIDDEGLWKGWFFTEDMLISVEDELREVSRRLKDE